MKLLSPEKNWDIQMIDGFVRAQVLGKGLDNRTEKAYRLDLEHLSLWLAEQNRKISEKNVIEEYLDYLKYGKKLKNSTITRKCRVFKYYLEYLTAQGYLIESPSVVCPAEEKEKETIIDSELSRAEVDSFFMALNKEYENLDNEFRRRVCLRDCVMMELLFYHGIEISELLRLKVSDYNRNTGVLLIQGKRGKERSEYLFSRELRRKMEQWIGQHGYFEKENEFHNVLFLSKIGKSLSMKMVILVFDKYRILAGIEKASTPKDLKHSMKRYAKEMLMERCG